MAIVSDRLLSLTLNRSTLHLTGCNATNLAVFPITYLLQPAARRSEIGDLVPVNFKQSLMVGFIVVLETYAFLEHYLFWFAFTSSLFGRGFEYLEGLMMVGGV